MHATLRRGLALGLVIALTGGLIPPPAARAEESTSSNATLGIGALVLVVAVIVAWQLDFGADDDALVDRRLRLTGGDEDRLALVLTDVEPADPERGELVSGVALRAWF